MLQLILGLAILGVCLYLLKTYVPMDPAISTLITVVVVLCAIAWLLGAFGVVDLPLPAFRRSSLEPAKSHLSEKVNNYYTRSRSAIYLDMATKR